MRRNDEDARSADHLVEPGLRLRDEGRVPRADQFVHDEDLRDDSGRDGKCEAKQHTSRIGAQRQLEELAKLRKRFDLGNHPAHLADVQAQEHAAQHDVLVARRLEVHAHRDVRERGDGPFDPSPARERLVDTGKHSQQRRFPGAVLPNEAEAVAVRELQVDVAQRHHRDVAAQIRLDLAPDRPPEQLSREPPRARVVDWELDRDPLERNGRHAVRASRRCGRGIARRKTS